MQPLKNASNGFPPLFIFVMAFIFTLGLFIGVVLGIFCIH